jgi:hypothetical protein
VTARQLAVNPRPSQGVRVLFAQKEEEDTPLTVTRGDIYLVIPAGLQIWGLCEKGVDATQEYGLTR